MIVDYLPFKYFSYCYNTVCAINAVDTVVMANAKIINL